MLQNALRERFTDGSLNTASGPKVIGLAYDRLDRDLAGAIAALDAKDVPKSHELLVHAQDIVHELLCMLDLDAWEHAPALASIYRYVTDLLLKANISKSAAPAIEARRHLAELGEAFKSALTAPTATTASAGSGAFGGAAGALATAGAPRGTGFGGDAEPQRRLSVRA